ncbi:hypothetical protein Cfor_06758 [Coptotermes formosanus]|uniref:Uncharacterized protein n=1 Tax=Coptotermes formosanus TaxID=36987 RepID=A0A6L2PLF5_COPFO|nr:hypothetical protein Cfor_06758 [Coptotermes formosanus]
MFGQTPGRKYHWLKLWHYTGSEIVDNSLEREKKERTHIWKTCCEKEINRDIRTELLSSCWPGWHILCPSNYEWRVVYKTWCQWHHIGKWSFITKIFEDTSLTPVTCMKISGRCITTGHSNGDVLLWSYSNRVKVASHLRYVTALGVMVYTGECNNNSQLKHELVVSASLDCTIHISPLTFQDEMPHGCHVIREHLSPVTEIRTFRNTFAALSCDDRISIWQLSASTCNKVPTIVKLHTLSIYMVPFEAISIWGNEIIQVSAVTCNGLSIPIFRGGDSSPYKLLQVAGHQHFASSSSCNNISGRILKAFLWRYGVSIILDDQHYMYITVNECGQQMKYNTMPYLHSYPVTVLLYGEILLLGMESGTLYMYQLDQITDLLTLDLGAVYWKHSLCSEPIIDLDINETSNGPVIAAAANSRVWYITFIPPGLR